MAGIPGGLARDPGLMLKHRGAWLIGAWSLVALVCYLSLMPAPPAVFTFHWSDKFEHCTAYAAMSLWFCQIYAESKQRIKVAAALVAMGVTIEFLQGWSGYRYFEYADMAANSTGVLLGVSLAHTRLGRIFVWIEKLGDCTDDNRK